MCCMRFPHLLVILGWCVPGYFVMENFRFNIYYQAFPPANTIFAGIGVLLLVGVLHVLIAQTFLTVDTAAPGG